MIYFFPQLKINFSTISIEASANGSPAGMKGIPINEVILNDQNSSLFYFLNETYHEISNQNFKLQNTYFI